ncbi:hypothetical protein GCM10022631_11230 [Deinococcus rubellus]|uniref:hypothetical protein n=1 Tax=Deinococcus rubellus TaxID=1889240 RepID=UPI0031ED987C
MLYGPDDRPLPPSQPREREAAIVTPQLRGGSLPYATPGDSWGQDQVTAGGWTYADGIGTTSRYGVSRTFSRRTCRMLYLLPNPMFWGAIQLVTAFLGGDDMSYGQMDDKTAQLALDEFWQANSLDQLMTERFWTEFFLDGENATVFPTGDADPGGDMPARVAFLDVDAAVEVEGSTARGAVASDMASRITLSHANGERDVWEAGQFVWTADGAHWNDLRGFPVAAAAADASAALIALYNHRLNVHDVQQRLVAVYTALMDPLQPDGGKADWQRKTAGFRNLPRRGGVIPLVAKPGYTDMAGNRFDGVRESLEFPHPASGASDAATDQRSFLRLVGLALGGIPEHWLGEGGHVNRSTASEMNTPAVRVALKRQGTGRGYLNRLMCAELKRRFGPSRLYTVKTTTVSRDGLTRTSGRKRLPADLLEFPWILPDISEDSLQMLINRSVAASANGWASPQTLSGSLGFDPSAENELMAAAGLNFGQPRSDAAAAATAATASPNSPVP